MKNWNCLFESQKGHPLYKKPDFNRFIEVVVTCKFKNQARELAEEELKLFDPDYFEKYRAPVIEQATDLQLEQYKTRKLNLLGESVASDGDASVLTPAPTYDESIISVYEFPICSPWVIRVGTAVIGEKYGYSCLITDRTNNQNTTDIGNVKHLVSVSFDLEDDAIIAGLRQAANLIDYSDQLGHDKQACIRMANGYCTLTKEEREEHYVCTVENNETTTQENVRPDANRHVLSDSGLDVADSPASGGHSVDLSGTDLEEKHDQNENVEQNTSDHAEELKMLNQELLDLDVGQILVKDDLPNKLYHECIGISSTNLKEELISSKYRHNLETGEIERVEKHHFTFGSFVHCLLLQPHLVNKEYSFEPELPDGAYTSLDSMKEAIRTFNENHPDNKVPISGTKKELAERIRQHIDEQAVFKHELDEQWQAEVDNGRLPVSLEDQKRAERMVKSALNNPAIRNWYKIKNNHTACERSYFTKTIVNVYGQSVELILKARLDKEIGQFIIDTKTIELRLDVKKEDAFGYINREIEKRGYHLSAAHYLAVTGKQKFYWIFHNKTLGYEWEVIIEAGDDHLHLGSFERDQALRSIARSKVTNEYQPPIIQPLDVNKNPKPLVSEITYYGFKRLELYIDGQTSNDDKELNHG